MFYKGIIFEMLPSNKLESLRKEARRDFEDYSKHPRKTAFIDEKMDTCSKIISASTLELESRRVKVAA